MALGARQVLHRPQGQAIERMGHVDAAIDRPGVQLAAAQLAQHHGAGTTIALAAALFGAGLVQILAQNLQDGALGRHIVQGAQAAGLYKSNRLGLCLGLGHEKVRYLRQMQG